ncbi:hypothetical protein MXMO3_00966 [Maritalea myrionectae]|uniref:Uncharacterized protein n=1 Tax=Maritalea myrionectae TaxID=454601 RepID=A0A2R4MBV1_9HYPH|nr:hypothetical protein [Maritalea myrionectae]AVX03497.1 hypothetical protein MXMO3_00966 [Maritalea myrionectae]
MDNTFCDQEYAHPAGAVAPFREKHLDTIAAYDPRQDARAIIDVASNNSIFTQLIPRLKIPGFGRADLDVGQSILPRDSHP